MTTISATTILRSRNAAAPEKVLSTLLLRYPRCIHAEFMTHRQFSRNAASSRAIPVAKLIADIEADPFVPLHWGANQKGMQAGEECNAPVLMGGDKNCPASREDAWLHAMEYAVQTAREFADAGYHKQIVNRLLEPYSHITVVVSATEWSNFRALRDHADAEPHIAMLAREIGKCLDDESTIQTLRPGEWHLPFVDQAEMNANDVSFDDRIRLSVARCASTSYKTVDGFDMTLDRAIALTDKLLASKPLHASPCEHVAQADSGAYLGDWKWHSPERHGNFVGFRQFRKKLVGECL